MSLHKQIQKKENIISYIDDKVLLSYSTGYL